MDDHPSGRGRDPSGTVRANKYAERSDIGFGNRLFTERTFVTMLRSTALCHWLRSRTSSPQRLAEPRSEARGGGPPSADKGFTIGPSGFSELGSSHSQATLVRCASVDVRTTWFRLHRDRPTTSDAGVDVRLGAANSANYSRLLVFRGREVSVDRIRT